MLITETFGTRLRDKCEGPTEGCAPDFIVPKIRPTNRPTFELRKTRFSAVKKIMNKHFAEKYSGLEFPLVKWEKSVNYDYMRRYLHALHEKQGGGMIGCIGEKQTFS